MTLAVCPMTLLAPDTVHPYHPESLPTLVMLLLLPLLRSLCIRRLVVRRLPLRRQQQPTSLTRQENTNIDSFIPMPTMTIRKIPLKRGLAVACPTTGARRSLPVNTIMDGMSPEQRRRRPWVAALRVPIAAVSVPIPTRQVRTDIPTLLPVPNTRKDLRPAMIPVIDEIVVRLPPLVRLPLVPALPFCDTVAFLHP